MFFKNKEDVVECKHCGYKIIRPFPKDQLCPRCNKFLQNLYKYLKEDEKLEEIKTEPKEFEIKTSTISSKLKGKVRVKKKNDEISLDSEKIELSKGEYLKLLGISSINRAELYCNNQRLVYLLELSNNLDFIATSFLGGSLDKMLLISDDGNTEKCQFLVKNNLIFIVYGQFPDKKGKWLLEQMYKNYSELIQGKDVDKLSKIETHNIELKFTGMLKYILKEYMELQDIFSDQDIPYVEDQLRVDYIGLSAKSIGVISLLLGDDLEINVPPMIEDPDEIKEMKESILTAKIEAIAANTYANTNAVPRWIAVKLGFQNYRFMTIKPYHNNFYLSLLSEGNLNKLQKAEEFIDPYISHATDGEFSGDLRPYNRVKLSLKEELKENRKFR